MTKKLAFLFGVIVASVFVTPLANANVVGYWKLDEGAGTTTADSSGYGHQGILNEATWVSGVSGNALYFDGQNDYVHLAGYSGLLEGSRFNDITVEGWFKTSNMPTADNGYATIVSDETSDGEFNVGIWPNTDAYAGRFMAQIYIEGLPTNSVRVWGPNSLDGEWHYFCVTKNSSEVALFFDGEKYDSVLTTGRLKQNQLTHVTLGCKYTSSPRNYFKGSIDEIIIWSEDISGPPGNPPSDEYFEGDQGDKSGYDRDPVNTATGNFFHSEPDISIMTRGIPLEFTRHYNSKSTYNGSLGIGWTHSYNIKLTEDANLVSIRWGDGRTDYWNPDDLGNYEPETPSLYDSLEKDSNDWIVTKKNLDVYTFDPNGLLQNIKDKNGNIILLEYNDYNDPNLVTSIKDPANRVLTLTYDSNGLLTSVSDSGTPPRTVSYSYIIGRLYQVVDVFGNTIDYTYDLNGYLTIINDQRSVNTVTNVYDVNGRVIEQTDGNGNTSTFAYDEPNEGKTTITDPNGKVTIHSHYTGYKLLASIENQLGDIISYNYDINGNRTSITDRNGNTTFFVYDSRGNVISTTEPNDSNDPYDGGTTLIEYSDSNFPDLPTKKTDVLGNITYWKYDSKGNAVRQINPDGNDITWTYNSFGQKLTETDENGHVTTYTYDANGLLIELADPNGNHTWYGYDTLWRLTQITDGRGTSAGDPNHTTVVAYDRTDRVTSRAAPIISESYEYDKVGNRTRVVNGRGYATVYEYDNNNNLVRIEREIPSEPNQVIQYAYDELNRQIRLTDPNGNVTQYEYDAAGRLIKEINAEANETAYTYDAHGNILSVTDGNDVTTFYEYDALNRKIHQSNELGNHWYWQYDKLGKITKHTDATAYVTRYEYDSLNRLISVIDDSNDKTEYRYDAVGNLTQIKDAGGRIISKKYHDASDRLIKQEDGLGNAYRYSYDGASNIVSVTDPNNQTKTLSYDNENRLIQVNYPDSSQVTYNYDNNGNLTGMVDLTGSTTYIYDALDRLISSTDGFGKTVQYGYDIIGNRTNITYPADSTNPARTVTYNYDKANRLDKITDWDGRVWDYTTDGAGRITQLLYPNAIKQIRVYDDAGRLSSLVYKNSSDANLISYTYTRDAQGNPTDVNESGTLSPNPLVFSNNISYTYDSDNRLTATTKPAAYSYDQKGNMTSRVSGGVTTTFNYDFDNRLTSQISGGSTVQHTYDGRGNRITRNDNGSITRYILDHGRDMSHILCETDTSGEITAYYIHGPEIVGRIGTDGSLRYYHTNHIGSVIALTNQTESITDRYTYTPFGIPAGNQGSTPNPFAYVGGLGVMAEADGLYFMRARFYEPSIGRFLEKDSVEGMLTEPITLHKYNYTADNPIIYADPDGEFIISGSVILAVSGTIALNEFVIKPYIVPAVVRGAERLREMTTDTKVENNIETAQIAFDVGMTVTNLAQTSWKSGTHLVKGIHNYNLAKIGAGSNYAQAQAQFTKAGKKFMEFLLHQAGTFLIDIIKDKIKTDFNEDMFNYYSRVLNHRNAPYIWQTDVWRYNYFAK